MISGTLSTFAPHIGGKRSKSVIDAQNVEAERPFCSSGLQYRSQAG